LYYPKVQTNSLGPGLQHFPRILS